MASFISVTAWSMGITPVRVKNAACKADGRVTEPPAGFLGVADEVRLAVKVGGVADDLDGILIRAHGAVRTHAPDFNVCLSGGSRADFLGNGQRSKGYVVHDTDGEIVLGCHGLEILVDCQNPTGRGILGAEAATSADNLHRNAPLFVNGANVLIQRLAHGTRFSGTVQNGKALAGLGNRVQEVVRGEGAVEVDVHQTDFFTLCGQTVHGFLCGFGGGTHEDDDPRRSSQRAGSSGPSAC